MPFGIVGTEHVQNIEVGLMIADRFDGMNNHKLFFDYMYFILKILLVNRV